MRVRSQYVTAGTDNLPYALDANAVLGVMRMFGIENDISTYDLVLAVGSHELKKLRDKQG